MFFSCERINEKELTHLSAMTTMVKSSSTEAAENFRLNISWGTNNEWT